MTDLEWFAYVIMPLTVVALAWGGAGFEGSVD